MADTNTPRAMEDLREYFGNCIRLSATNKINPKNAFEYHLIDMMHDLVNDNAGDGQMNFKVASSALDVGAKIYSFRVENIQSEAQKVASSILMALDGQNKKQDDGDGEGDTSAQSDRMDDSTVSNEGQSKGRTKKKSGKRKNVKTVVQDSTQLDGKLEKVALGDPLLDSLSQDYDMSCPAALICYNALTQSSCLLTIESSFSRKNYEGPTIAKKSKIDHNLSTITEESVSTEVDGGESKENGTQQGNSEEEHPRDQDGDSIMKDAAEEDVQDSNAMGPPPTSPHGTATINSINSNTSDQFNLVSLVTKYVNCAQIIRNNRNNKICPRLEHFLFNDRSTSLSGLASNLDESILSMGDEPSPMLNSSKIVGGAHQFDPQLYENNAGNDYGDDHFGDACSNAGDDDRNENDLIPNLDKIAASQPTEYGYSNEHHRLLNTWAGPHAWKVAKTPGRKNDGPKSTRKRARLEAKPIDYDEKYSVDLEKAAEKEIRHSSDVIRRWKKPLLPQDHNLSEQIIHETIAHTFLRPEDTYHCMKTPAEALKRVDIDHDYTKTGRNDESMDDAPSPIGMGGFDDVHDDSDDEFRADPMVENNVALFGATQNQTLGQQADLEFAGELLIEQPYTIAPVNIPFSKIAKRMDVRKLKRAIWDLLYPPEKRAETANEKSAREADVTVIENGQQNGAGDRSSTLMSGDEHDQTVIMNGDAESADLSLVKKSNSPEVNESMVHLEFSNLYGELPVRVSSKMADDLSRPIAFVTLLHLANEKVSLPALNRRYYSALISLCLT